MTFENTFTVEFSVLKKELRRLTRTITAYSKRQGGEYTQLIKNRCNAVLAGLSEKHTTVHAVKRDGNILPVGGVIYNESKSAKQIIKRIEDFAKSSDILSADIQFMPLMGRYCRLCEMHAAAKENDSERFAAYCGEMVFLSGPDLHEVSEKCDPVHLALSSSAEYLAADEPSRAAYRRMVAMTARAAKIREDRLCGYYLTECGKGRSLGALINEDYKRVLAPLDVKSYVGGVYLFSILAALVMILVTGRAAALLTFFPFYALVKGIYDGILLRSGVQVFPPAKTENNGRIPDSSPVLAVISTLLTCKKDIPAAIKRAEEFLSKNRTDNLQVCLLCDLKESRNEEEESDEEIKAACREYEENSGGRIFIYLRPRTYNAAQKRWMGKERKRGALCSLAESLVGGGGDFTVYGKGTVRCPKYLLLLDYDTESPIDGAARLTAFAEAVENRPVVENGRVVSGYGLFAPTCVPKLKSTMESGFSGIFAGRGGRAHSQYGGCGDFYMRTFCEGIFCGKGLVHLDAFCNCCLALPENKILSHDILEGALLRTAAVSEEFTESFPADSKGYFARLSRWQRGDIQNIPFIFSRLPFTALDRFKLCDNAMRVLIPVFTLLCFLTGDSVIALAAALGVLFTFLRSAVPGRIYASGVMSDFASALSRALCEFILIPRYAVSAAGALLVSLWRMARRRNMLCWVTSFQISKKAGRTADTVTRFILPEILSLAVLLQGRQSAVCFISGALFMSALPVMLALDKRSPKASTDISEKYRRAIISAAEKELNFFLEYSTAEDNYLIPDNVQTEPKYKVAHRTSPTNIGMYLLSLVCGFRMGILEREECENRLFKAFFSIDRLKKYHGNLYNWYDTKTLLPLDSFVSSVDSGNFLCCLTAVKQGLKEEFPELYDKASALLAEADMGVFYNKGNGLLAIGCDGETGKITPSSYDLLMSEARAASFYAVAKGQVPAAHWGCLSGIRYFGTGQSGGLSWSGTTFEYFMPQLFLPSMRGGAIYENLRYAVKNQKKAARNGIYGISESGYYAFDKELNYQYRAFGVGALSLRPDYYFEPVYSPYSAFLMLPFDFYESYNLLHRFREEGVYDNDYGYFEAVDYSDIRADGKKTVKSFMAHHKGMSVAAAANAICGGLVTNLFMSDEDMKRGTGMLEEKITDSEIFFKRPAPVPRGEAALHGETAEESVLLDNGRISAAAFDKKTAAHGGRIKTLWQGKSLFYPAVYGQYDRAEPMRGFTAVIAEGEHRYDIREGELKGEASGFSYTSQRRTLTVKEIVSLHKTLPCQAHEFEIANASSVPRKLDLMLYMRPALCTDNEATAHTAFSDLFLTCIYDEKENVITVCRRKRDSSEKVCMAIALPQTELFYCFDREKADTQNPLTENTDGFVPAPCVYVTIPFTVKPKEKVKLNIPICCAASEQAAKQAALKAREDMNGTASYKLRRAEPALSALIAASVLPHIAFKERGGEAPSVSGDFSQLWKYGIDTSRPAVKFTSENDGECLYAVLKAARRLMNAGYDFTLVIVCKKDAERIAEAARRSGCKAGSVAVIAQNDITDGELSLLEFFCVYSAKSADPISAATLSRADAKRLAVKSASALSKGREGFADGAFITTHTPAVPWCKPLANPSFGMLVATNSLGFCWAKNSALNKMTPWDNEITGINRGIRLFLREKNVYYDMIKSSACTFYKNCAEYISVAAGVICIATVTVPDEKTGALVSVRLVNRSEKEVRLSCVFAARLQSVNVTEESGGCVKSTRLTPDGFEGSFWLYGENAVYGTDYEKIMQGEVSVRTDGNALCGATEIVIPPHESADTDFVLGYSEKGAPPESDAQAILLAAKNGELYNLGKMSPASKSAGSISSFSRGYNPLLNERLAKPTLATLNDGASPLLKKEETKAPVFDTGDRIFDDFLSVWLPDQILKGRLYARTGFYQNGGAYGFRDQLQDAMAAVYFCPSALRDAVRRCCEAQFEQGDVLHWFHITETETKGVRTTCSDDMLWLALAAAHYAETTGDYAFLSEKVSYCTGDMLSPSENDRYMSVGRGEADSVINHALRAAEFGYKTGSHGLILMRGGDWNDSFNAVGEKGRGESVWLSMFYCMVCESLLKIPAEYVPSAQRECLAQRVVLLKEAINEHAYENGYYIRAFYDDGKKMGAQGAQYCEIDLLTQAFSVLASVDPTENRARSRSAVNIALSRLCDEKNGLIKLFTPPFSHEDEENNTGYVCAYPKGVRENGGQYTHAAIWLCMAVNRLGYRDEAAKLLKMLCPCYKDERVYKNEPYYLSADVYTNPYCYGRGGWSIYTGAAGWYYRAAMEIFAADRGGQFRL